MMIMMMIDGDDGDGDGDDGDVCLSVPQPEHLPFGHQAWPHNSTGQPWGMMIIA